MREFYYYLTKSEWDLFVEHLGQEWVEGNCRLLLPLPEYTPFMTEVIETEDGGYISR